jgi:8-oxo-dGTP diphosphatase
MFVFVVLLRKIYAIESVFKNIYRRMSYTYPYPHPAVATDCVVFGFDGRGLKILLIRRGVEPYLGRWAFPGGFMRMEERAEDCARRELQEETGLDVQMLKQLGAFSDLHRDPRERVVSIAFYTLVQPSAVVGGDDASHAEWFSIEDVPQLAFDHDYMLRKAMQQLRKDIYFEPIGFELLDKEFTMSELQCLYESILGVRFDRRNFEKKMLQTGILQTVGDDDGADCFCSAPPKSYFGEKRQMRTKSIDALFGPEQGDVRERSVSFSIPFKQEDDFAEECGPQRRKPGRRGRKFSFNKEQYDRFKQDKNFRFEF